MVFVAASFFVCKFAKPF